MLKVKENSSPFIYRRFLSPNRFIPIILTIALFFFLNYYFFYLSERSRIRQVRHKLERSLTVQNGGRLGSNILEYASVWSLGRSGKLQPYVPYETLSELVTVFEALSVPSLNDLMLDVEKTTEGREAMKNLTMENMMSVTADERLPPKDMLFCNRGSGHPVVLRHNVFLYNRILPEMDSLRKEMRFKKILKFHVQRTMETVEERIQKFTSRKEKVTFVGVQVRHTDYTPYLLRMQNKASTGFYRRATLFLRELLLKTSHSPIAFLLTSDNPSWCRKRLVHRLLKPESHVSRIAYEGDIGGVYQDSDGVVGVYFVGNGDVKSPGNDLAVLSSCNHTIFSYGTFGLSAALFSGGITVAFNLTLDGVPSIPVELAKKYDNWHVID